jgi:glyoxylase-like metal-dependent hydrolase (beta-lactamase superfamily II)
MPHVDPVDGLAMMTTDLGYMTVNAYVIWDPETRQAVTFDTGATCDPLIQCILNKGLTVSHVYITHTHLDHVMDIVRLQEETGVHGYGPAIENPLGLRPLKPGDAFVVGNLKIKVLDTSGHTPGGLSYFITGLSHPIVVVGDALFAGSIGGAAAAYDQALRNLRDHVFTLPDETIVCPGHGPLTTIGHEKIWNPFFVEYKSRT